MLEIRPNCECCDKDLPPQSSQAMICSFECTFCRDCVDSVLSGICPNCGGGFAPRPVRPESALSRYPASHQRVHTPYSLYELRQLVAKFKAGSQR